MDVLCEIGANHRFCSKCGQRRQARYFENGSLVHNVPEKTIFSTGAHCSSQHLFWWSAIRSKHLRHWTSHSWAGGLYSTQSSYGRRHKWRRLWPCQKYLAGISNDYDAKLSWHLFKDWRHTCSRRLEGPKLLQIGHITLFFQLWFKTGISNDYDLLRTVKEQSFFLQILIAFAITLERKMCMQICRLMPTIRHVRLSNRSLFM